MYKLSKNRRLAKLVAASVALNAVGGMTVPIYAAAAENVVTNTNKATSGMSNQQLLQVLTQASGIEDDTEFAQFIAESFGSASGYQAAISEADKAGGDLAEIMDQVTERIQNIVKKIKDAGNIKIQGATEEAKLAKAKEVYAKAIKQKQDCDAEKKANKNSGACVLSAEGQNAANYIMMNSFQVNTSSANPVTTKVVDTKGTSKIENKDTRWHRDPKTGLWVENTNTTTNEFCDEGYEMKDGKCVKTIEVAPEPTPEPTPETKPEPTLEPTPETKPEPAPEVKPEPTPGPLNCPEGYASNMSGMIPDADRQDEKCVKKLADCASDEIVFKDSDGNYSCKKDISDVSCPAGQVPVGGAVSDVPPYMPSSWVECATDETSDPEPEPTPEVEKCGVGEALYGEKDSDSLKCKKLECPEDTVMVKTMIDKKVAASPNQLWKDMISEKNSSSDNDRVLAFTCRKIPEEYLKKMKCTDGQVFSTDEGKCVTPEKTDVTTCEEGDILVGDKCMPKDGYKSKPGLDDVDDPTKEDPKSPDKTDKCAEGLIYKEDVKGCVTPETAKTIDEANHGDDNSDKKGGSLGGILGALGTIGALASVFGGHGGGGDGGIIGEEQNSNHRYTFNYLMEDKSGIHYFPSSSIDDIQFVLFGPKNLTADKQPIATITYQVPIKQAGGDQTAVFETRTRRIPFNEKVVVFPKNIADGDITLKELQQYGTIERIPADNLSTKKAPYYVMTVEIIYPDGERSHFMIHYDFTPLQTRLLPNPDENLEKGTNELTEQPFSLDLHGKITGARWDADTNTCYINVSGDIYDNIGRESASGEVTVNSQRYTEQGCQNIGENGINKDISLRNIGQSTDANGERILVDDNATAPTLDVDMDANTDYTTDKGYDKPMVEPQTAMMDLGTDANGNPIQAGIRIDGKNIYDAESNIMDEEKLRKAAQQMNEQYGTNFSRIGYCQGEVSHNVGDVCGYEVDANGNEVAKRLTDGKGFKQGYSVTGGTIDRALSKSEYENNRREYGYDDFAKSTGSIGDFLKRKTKSATSFGNATLDEINAVFSGRKFDPNQMVSAPILRTTVEEISASATMTKGKSHNDDSQNEAQKKKQEKSTAKADDTSVSQPSTMTNIAKAVVSTANNVVNMASGIGAGLSLKDTINNMGWKSNTDSFGMTGKQDLSSTSTSAGTTKNPAEPPSAVNGGASEAESSKSDVQKKTYTATGYGAAGQSIVLD